MYKPKQLGEPTDVIYQSTIENDMPGTGKALFNNQPSSMKQASIAQGQKEIWSPQVAINLMARHTDLNHSISEGRNAGQKPLGAEQSPDSEKTLFNRQGNYPGPQQKVGDDYGYKSEYLNKKRPVSEAS